MWDCNFLELLKLEGLLSFQTQQGSVNFPVSAMGSEGCSLLTPGAELHSARSAIWSLDCSWAYVSTIPSWITFLLDIYHTCKKWETQNRDQTQNHYNEQLSVWEEKGGCDHLIYSNGLSWKGIKEGWAFVGLSPIMTTESSDPWAKSVLLQNQWHQATGMWP